MLDIPLVSCDQHIQIGLNRFFVVYYFRTYVNLKAVCGRRVKRGDVCYGMLRAAACVDEQIMIDSRAHFLHSWLTGGCNVEEIERPCGRG